MTQTTVKTRRKFDETFKREAVQNWLQSGKSAAVIAEELGLDAHRRGLKVFAFTVNEPKDIARMKTLGVDGVFSDFPERV